MKDKKRKINAYLSQIVINEDLESGKIYHWINISVMYR
jgi:hypothetical protein